MARNIYGNVEGPVPEDIVEVYEACISLRINPTALALTPDEARDVARRLNQAADEFEAEHLDPEVLASFADGLHMVNPIRKEPSE